MNLLFGLPAALAALAALLLPLLLHLARRQQQVPTVFAALRWLRAKPKPRRRIRFDEWLLLAVRLLLVALLALWLARPVLEGLPDTTPWVVVAPGVDPATLGDLPAGANLRWLAPGFPSLDQPPPASPVPVASLLRELDASLPQGAALTAWVPERLAGADGERPRLSRAVDWRVAQDAGVAPRIAQPPAPTMAIRFDADHAAAARFLRAAALSWRADASDDGIDSAGTPGPIPADGVGVLAWWRSEAVPADLLRWVEQGGDLLVAADSAQSMPAATVVAWRDASGAPLLDVAALGRGRVLRFARPLEPRVMPELLDAGFARRLRDVLQPPPAPTVVSAADFAPRTGGEHWLPSPRDLQPWWAVLIALLALLERWLATSRRRGAVA